MADYKVRLELARTKEFPHGNAARGYELVLPLDAEGHLDEAAWRENRKRYTVRRFWDNEPEEHGHLIHTRRREWAFSYAPGEDDDTPIFSLATHVFKSGEYISIREQDGETQTFRIVQVSPLA
jgi:hypothetical protein